MATANPACLLLLVLACLPAGLAAAPQDPAGLPQRAAAVHRHGITWRFDGDHVVGAFANGDPWVVGPVRLLAIEPSCVEVAGRVLHGSMVDPDPTRREQGYDSALAGAERHHPYRAEANAALVLRRGDALWLRPVQSLVSVASRPEPGGGPPLQTAAVLTCVAAPPPPDAFRPPYGRGDKVVRHRAADLDFAALAQLAPLGTEPRPETLSRAFERVWLDHLPGPHGRDLHPWDNLPHDDRDYAALVGSAGLLLQLDLPRQQKHELLVRFVQLGIDLHGLLRGGGRWPGQGGQGGGRKFPILFAGRLLGDERMLAVGREFPSAAAAPGRGGACFAEDGQTFVVRETAPGLWNGGHGGYRREHEGLAEWGFAHAERPELDRADWHADPHRLCCTANSWVGQTLAARVLGLQAAWQHEPFFAYMDRYLQAPHAVAWQRAWVAWHAQMWDAYRANH